MRKKVFILGSCATKLIQLGSCVSVCNQLYDFPVICDSLFTACVKHTVVQKQSHITRHSQKISLLSLCWPLHPHIPPPFLVFIFFVNEGKYRCILISSSFLHKR